MTKPPLDHLRSRKNPSYRRISISFDSSFESNRDEVRSRVTQLELRPRVGRQLDPGEQIELSSLKDELEEAERLLQENSATFHVTSLGPTRYEELTSEHPPTPEQRKEAKRDGNILAWNQDTFPYALLAEAAHYVYVDEDTGEERLEVLGEEFVKEMREGDQWSQGEIMQLVQIAVDVNSAFRRVGGVGNV